MATDARDASEQIRWLVQGIDPPLLQADRDEGLDPSYRSGAADFGDRADARGERHFEVTDCAPGFDSASIERGPG